MRYEFKNPSKLINHYRKHVLGIGALDPREKEQFEKNGVNTEEKYVDCANDNIIHAKRIFNYVLDNGNKSYNYQKENISYKENMKDDEYEGLLTTCLNNRKKHINSCFYRTINYSNIELIAMANALYNERNIIADGINLYLEGFYDSHYPKALKDSFIDIYKKYEIDLHYDKEKYFKLIIINFIKDNIKEYNDNNHLNYNLWVVFTCLCAKYLEKEEYEPTDFYKSLDEKNKDTYREKFIKEQLFSMQVNDNDEDDIISLLYRFANEIEFGTKYPSSLFRLFTKE